MREYLSIAILACALHAPALSQPLGDPERLVVYMSDRTLNSGYYLRLSNDSLIIFSDDRELSVAMEDLVRVDRVIVHERELGAIGMLVGFYGSIALGAFDSGKIPVQYCPECRMGYISNGSLSFFLGIASTVPPGLLGYLLDNSNDDPARVGSRETFSLDGDPAARDERERELAQSLETALRRPLSFGVHGGYLLAGSRPRYNDELADAGYRPGEGSINTGRFDSYTAEQLTPLLWFRSMELHYRVIDEADLGLTLVNLADPGVIVNRADPSGAGTRVRIVEEGISGSAWLISGRYRPFRDSRFGSGLVMTGGVGRASVGYHRNGFDDTVSANGATIRGVGSREIFECAPLAGLVAIEYSLPITPATTLGVSFDYLPTAPSTIPGTPSLDIPERRLSAGNASVGFRLGWRF